MTEYGDREFGQLHWHGAWPCDANHAPTPPDPNR